MDVSRGRLGGYQVYLEDIFQIMFKQVWDVETATSCSRSSPLLFGSQAQFLLPTTTHDAVLFVDAHKRVWSAGHGYCSFTLTHSS